MITVTAAVTLRVDPEKYIAQGVEADWFEPDEIDPTELSEVADQVAGRWMEEEQLIPRWARGSIELLESSVTYQEGTQ